MTVVTVPDLSYKDKNTAEKLLKQAGLTPEYIGEDYSDELSKRTGILSVCQQRYTGGKRNNCPVYGQQRISTISPG